MDERILSGEYEKVKKYITERGWHISGGSINASDVMVPSAESVIRNFLYGQSYYKKNSGEKEELTLCFLTVLVSILYLL